MLPALVALVLSGLIAGPPPALAASARSGALDPWSGLWTPKPESVARGGVLEHEGAAYDTLETRAFIVYFPRGAGEDVSTLAFHVAARLDNLYDFLAARAGLKPAVPIKAVLVAGRRGRARAYPEDNAVTVGAEGSFLSIVGSLFHELSHLFNLTQPGAEQDFWSGELLSHYYDDRLLTLGRRHRERYRRVLATRPERMDWSWISLLDAGVSRLSEREGQLLIELGISAHYYLEDEFGAAKVDCFRRARLDPAERAKPEVWRRCFGKGLDELQAGWRDYYR